MHERWGLASSSWYCLPFLCRLFANLARGTRAISNWSCGPRGRPRAHLAAPRYVIAPPRETDMGSAVSLGAARAGGAETADLSYDGDRAASMPYSCAPGAVPPTAGGTHAGVGLWYTLLHPFAVELPVCDRLRRQLHRSQIDRQRRRRL